MHLQYDHTLANFNSNSLPKIAKETKVNLLHSIFCEQIIFHHRKSKKKAKQNSNWIGIINNNYNNSRNKIQPESGMKPFFSNHNSFLNFYKNIIKEGKNYGRNYD